MQADSDLLAGYLSSTYSAQSKVSRTKAEAYLSDQLKIDNFTENLLDIVVDNAKPLELRKAAASHLKTVGAQILGDSVPGGSLGRQKQINMFTQRIVCVLKESHLTPLPIRKIIANLVLPFILQKDTRRVILTPYIMNLEALLRRQASQDDRMFKLLYGQALMENPRYDKLTLQLIGNSFKAYVLIGVNTLNNLRGDIQIQLQTETEVLVQVMYLLTLYFKRTDSVKLAEVFCTVQLYRLLVGLIAENPDKLGSAALDIQTYVISILDSVLNIGQEAGGKVAQSIEQLLNRLQTNKILQLILARCTAAHRPKPLPQTTISFEFERNCMLLFSTLMGFPGGSSASFFDSQKHAIITDWLLPVLRLQQDDYDNHQEDPEQFVAFWHQLQGDNKSKQEAEEQQHLFSAVLRIARRMLRFVHGSVLDIINIVTHPQTFQKLSIFERHSYLILLGMAQSALQKRIDLFSKIELIFTSFMQNINQTSPHVEDKVQNTLSVACIIKYSKQITQVEPTFEIRYLAFLNRMLSSSNNQALQLFAIEGVQNLIKSSREAMKTGILFLDALFLVSRPKVLTRLVPLVEQVIVYYHNQIGQLKLKQFYAKLVSALKLNAQSPNQEFSALWNLMDTLVERPVLYSCVRQLEEKNMCSMGEICFSAERETASISCERLLAQIVQTVKNTGNVLEWQFKGVQHFLRLAAVSEFQIKPFLEYMLLMVNTAAPMWTRELYSKMLNKCVSLAKSTQDDMDAGSAVALVQLVLLKQFDQLTLEQVDGLHQAFVQRLKLQISSNFLKGNILCCLLIIMIKHLALSEDDRGDTLQVIMGQCGAFYDPKYPKGIPISLMSDLVLSDKLKSGQALSLIRLSLRVLEQTISEDESKRGNHRLNQDQMKPEQSSDSASSTTASDAQTNVQSILDQQLGRPDQFIVFRSMVEKLKSERTDLYQLILQNFGRVDKENLKEVLSAKRMEGIIRKLHQLKINHT